MNPVKIVQDSLGQRSCELSSRALRQERRRLYQEQQVKEAPQDAEGPEKPGRARKGRPGPSQRNPRPLRGIHGHRPQPTRHPAGAGPSPAPALAEIAPTATSTRCPSPPPPPTMAPCLLSPLAPAALEKRKRRPWARAGASTESSLAEARQALAVGALSETTLTLSVDLKSSAWPGVLGANEAMPELQS